MSRDREGASNLIQAEKNGLKTPREERNWPVIRTYTGSKRPTEGEASLVTCLHL